MQHYTGSLTEETQYYPFGLVQKGTSNKAFGRLENKKKFNGYEENKTFDLNWLESLYRTYDPQLGRFWQLDPKPTDFESLYSAMGNSPMLKNDPLGDTIVLPNATDVFIAQFNDAKAYLIENGVGDLILRAEKMKGTLKIQETSDGISTYDLTKKTLFWNPNKGADFENGILISATTVLNHEMDHAVDHFKNPKANENRSGQNDKQYRDKEERRVITTSEQKTALALGEIKPGQVTRNHHGGHVFPTSNVRSTIHKHLDKVIEYKKRLKEITDSFQNEKTKKLT